MHNLEFITPTHIVFGKDRIKRINDLIPTGAKVLITCGGGNTKSSGRRPAPTAERRVGRDFFTTSTGAK